jgi:hypothetical protein
MTTDPEKSRRACSSGASATDARPNGVVSTAVARTASALEAIRQVDGRLRCFIDVWDDAAMDRAREMDGDGETSMNPHPAPLPKRERESENVSHRQAASGVRDGGVSELDRWILSELNACCVRVYDSLEAYDNFAAAKELIRFIDGLSNWYVRRTRDRFWKSEHDADKHAAYATLHECLVTLTKLIAPFTPFIAETM